MVSPDRPWVRLACDFYDDEGMYNVHALAELLYARALAHSKRARAGGFVHVRALTKLTARMQFDPGSDLNPEALAQQLVDEALWAEVEDGWMIRSWGKWQDTNEQEAEQAKQSRADKSRAAHTMHHKNGKHASARREGCPLCSLHAETMQAHADACSETETDADTDTEVSTTLVNPQSGSTPAAEPFEAEFASWWNHYPRKVNRAKAFKAYKARRREGIAATDLERALDNYAAEVDGEPAEYTMHGSTFLAKGGPWSERLDGPIHNGTRRPARTTRAERTADRLDGWLDSWVPDEPSDQGPYPYPIASQELSA